MNLREAILAGARRVSARCQGHYLTFNSKGDPEACLLGAAYLGCHPEAKLSDLVDKREPFNAWINELTKTTASTTWPGTITIDNDFHLPMHTGFAEAIDALEDRRSDILDFEVCDTNTGE